MSFREVRTRGRESQSHLQRCNKLASRVVAQAAGGDDHGYVVQGFVPPPPIL